MKKKNNDDLWIYVSILSALMIFAEALKSCIFRVAYVDLTYSIFLLPVSFFLVNYIARKYDYRKAIAAIAISSVMFASFSGIMSFVFVEKLMISSVIGEVCAYVISQLISLFLYLYIISNHKTKYALILLNYIFALVIFYMIYTLIYLNIIVGDTYWLGYFITLVIQLVICIFLTLFEKKIK